MSTPSLADFQVVWLSDGDHGFPHAEALAASNPEVGVSFYHVPSTGEDGWRNCDRNIRTWWRENGAATTTRRVLFLEWDVRVNRDLKEIFPPGEKAAGITGAQLRTRLRDARRWPVFQESNRLPEAMQPHAVGISPLSAVMISRPALDAVAATELDAVFAADVFSELRLPTVIRCAGFACEAHAGLSQVTCGPSMDPGSARGIFHPVKGGGR